MPPSQMSFLKVRNPHNSILVISPGLGTQIFFHQYEISRFAKVSAQTNGKSAISQHCPDNSPKYVILASRQFSYFLDIHNYSVQKNRDLDTNLTSGGLHFGTRVDPLGTCGAFVADEPGKPTT